MKFSRYAIFKLINSFFNIKKRDGAYNFFYYLNSEENNNSSKDDINILTLAWALGAFLGFFGGSLWIALVYWSGIIWDQESFLFIFVDKSLEILALTLAGWGLFLDLDTYSIVAFSNLLIGWILISIFAMPLIILIFFIAIISLNEISLFSFII
ncbi:MAG: hypothetical protein ACTSX4_11255 [Candidatus Helarchaeota archaeon]